MQNKKIIKNSSILIAVLLCITAFFSAGFGALRVGAYSEGEVKSLYEDCAQMVAESGADPDGCFKIVFDSRFGADLEMVYHKLNLIVYIADTHARITSDYSDVVIDDLTYESKLHVKQKRDELLELLIVNKEDFFGNELEFMVWANDYRAIVEQMENELNELVRADKVALENYLNDVASKLYAHYEKLMAFTVQNPSSNERKSSEFIIPAQQTALRKLIEEYVVVETLDGTTKYFVNKDGAFSYFASIPANSTEREHYDKAKEIYSAGIEYLNKLPKNSIELAYAAYNDWLNADSNPSLSVLAKNAKLEAAKKEVKKAELVYNNSTTSEEVISTYSEIITILKGFMNDPDTAVDSEKVSYRRDDRNVVKVTAIYSSTKKEVKVIPEKINLKVYPSFNGSAARNATQKIKEGDKNLSVAYLVYIEFYTDYGRVYNLPQTDNDGRAIEYKVEVNLNRYYQYYLKGKNYYTDEKASITNAYERINKEDYEMQSSLCYSYASGEVKQLNYTFDGENIVFYTKTFSNFCFAGIDTSTLFQNPLFWVLVVAVLILLIIVIKIIIKHTRYSVKFYSNGGSPVKKVKAAKNEYFVMPAPPVKQNFVFAGWYTDKALTNKFIGIQMRRRKSIKLYAKWSAPVTKDRLQEFYDILRKSMVGYQKVSFKPTLGLVEKEHLVSMFLRENNVEIYLAEEVENLKKAGFNVSAHEDKKFSELPCKVIVSSENTFAEALELIKKVFTDKGLQLRDESDRANDKMNVLDDKENGFAYFITNERIAKEPADFAELLRIAIKGYVLEEDNGNFKEGDVFTFARVYANEKEAQLYLPIAKGAKPIKTRDARFADTPRLINVMSADDIPEAYKAIEKVMLSYGFVKNPESSNDLKDVNVPEGHGFAYTLRF